MPSPSAHFRQARSPFERQRLERSDRGGLGRRTVPALPLSKVR